MSISPHVFTDYFLRGVKRALTLMASAQTMRLFMPAIRIYGFTTNFNSNILVVVINIIPPVSSSSILWRQVIYKHTFPRFFHNNMYQRYSDTLTIILVTLYNPCIWKGVVKLITKVLSMSCAVNILHTDVCCGRYLNRNEYAETHQFHLRAPSKTGRAEVQLTTRSECLSVSPSRARRNTTTSSLNQTSNRFNLLT